MARSINTEQGAEMHGPLSGGSRSRLPDARARTKTSNPHPRALTSDACLRFFILHLTMKRTIRALQSRPSLLIHPQRPVALVCSNSHVHLSESSQPRVGRQKLVTPSESFHRVPDATLIEEELLPGYRAEDYYPLTTEQTLYSRYRIICKLGHGVGSTVWLAGDVKYDRSRPYFYVFNHFANRVSGTSQYRAIKVCTRTTDGAVPAQASQEIAVAEYLKTALVQEHPGRRSVRTALDSFTLHGPHGTHTCLVYIPQGMTFTELREYLPKNRLTKRMLQTSVQVLLIAMDYLHKNSIVHTGKSISLVLRL